MSRFRPSRNYVSGKVVFDGGPVDISGDLVVSGSITANEYNVNVINTNVTHIDADGNTKFGDTPDDTHQFTGSVFINGPLSASSIIGGGATTPGAPNTSVQFNDAGAFAGDPDFTWDNTANILTVSGDITASVNISGAFFYGDGSGLTGVTATASPAGTNAEIQYNADGALGADADFTWSSGSNALSVNGSITSSVILISSSDPGPLLTICGNDLPCLMSVDTSSSVDGGARVLIGISNDEILLPTATAKRGALHIEQESTSSAAITSNGISVYTYAQEEYESSIRLHTWDPQPGNASSLSFYTNEGTFPNGGGVATGQALGRINFGGWDGNQSVLGYYVQAKADENWTFGTKNGSYLQFFSTPEGRGASTNLKERIRMTGEGHLVVFPYSASNDDADLIQNNFLSSPGSPALQVYGPTLFGSSSANTHIFTGSVNIAGDLTASANVSASFFHGDGSNLTNLPAGTPAGSDTQIQFNNAGAFGASADLTWDGTNLSSSTIVPNATITYDLGSADLSWNTLYTDSVIGDLQGAILFDAVNDEGDSISKGQAVYINGISGQTPTVALAACDDPAKMPAFGLAAANAINGAAVQIVTFGSLQNINLTTLYGQSFSGGDTAYVQTGSGGTSGSLTPFVPTGSSHLIQNLGIIVRNGGGGDGQIKVGGAGRTNATPNLDKGYLFVGNDSNQSVQDNTLFVSSSAGRVGINNINPTHALAVTGDISASVNVSASAFYGDGSNLTNVNASLLIGKSLFVDSVNGDDGTGVRGDESLPYLTIDAAITDSLSGDAIYVGPGIYPESGLSLPSGRSLIGSAGYTRTSLGITSSATDILTTVDDTWVEGFTFNIPTGSGNAGIRYTGAGGTMQAYSLAYAGDGASGLGDGFVKTGTGKVIGSEVRLTMGGLNSVVRSDQGVMAFESIHVPVATGDIEHVALVEGSSRAQLINFNAGNSNVVNTITVTGSATAICLAVNWFDVQNGLNIQQDGVNVEINGGKIQPSAYSVTMNNSETFTSASVISLTNINSHPDFNFPPSALNAQFEVTFATTENTDHYASETLFGTDFAAGFPEKGSAISVGNGPSYATGMKVYTSDGTDTTTTTGSLIDVTISASSHADTPFTFQGGSANHCIYFGSTRVDVNSDPLKYYGINVDTSIGSLTGAYVYEVWDGTEWADVDYQCTSVTEGYRYANNPFMRTDNDEFIRFGIEHPDTVWATSSIDGNNAYWSRCRITTSASLPQFRKWWLTPTHLSISDKGVRQSHGESIWEATLVGAGNIFGESGGVVTANNNVGSGAAPTGWTHRMPNSLLNQDGDAIYTQFALPAGIDTSLPLKFKIIYSLDDSGASVQFPSGTLSALPLQVTGIDVADPDGGKIPIPRIFDNTETLTSKVAPMALTEGLQPEGATLGDDLSNRLFSITYKYLSIEEYYEDDIIAVRFELEDDGDPAYDVAIWAVIVVGHKFTEGKRH
jgi:hypothetical protein